MSLVDDYLVEDYKIQCAKINLVKVADDTMNPENQGKMLISGPGYFHVRSNGAITFRIYNEIPVNNEIIHEWNNPIEAADKHYVIAYDYTGKRWIAQKPSLTNISNFLPTRIFPVLGETRRLESSIDINGNDSKGTANGYGIYYREIVKLPYSEIVSQKIQTGDIVKKERLIRTILPVFLEKTEIKLEKEIDEKYFYMHGIYPVDIQENFFDQCLIDALNYCTSSMLKPRLITHFEKSKIKIFINNTNHVLQNEQAILPNILPSWNTKNLEHGPKPELRFSNAFAAYLKYCMRQRKKDEDSNYRNISTIFENLCLSSSESPYNLAESLCIGCEYCFNLLTRDVKFSSINGTVIQELISNIPQEFFHQHHLDKSQIERIRSTLLLLQYPSAGMKLGFLVRHQVITKKQSQAWQAIRNKLLHGSVLSGMSTMKFTQCIVHLIFMFYRLTYQLIGYEGECYDFDDTSNKYKIIDFHLAKFES